MLAVSLAGVSPETLEEWKLLLQLSQQQRDSSGSAQPSCKGLSNGSCDSCSHVSPETLMLRLARIIGPDRAIETLEGCGICLELGPRSRLVCELLRMAEKRQR